MTPNAVICENRFMGRTTRHYTFQFNPLIFLQEPLRTQFQHLLEAQFAPSTFHLIARRCREYWATSLPTGVFLGDFRPGAVDYETDQAAFSSAFAKLRKQHGGTTIQLSQLRFEDDGQFFYHQRLITYLREQEDASPFLRALGTFLLHAKDDPALIRPRHHQRPFVPPEERLKVFGNRARGPAWSQAEDMVLRQWFGIRTVGDNAGMHTRLTEVEWQRVLEALGHRRTRASIRQRIMVLNHAVLRRYLVNGYVPADQVRAYMNEVLGECPRCPRRPAPKPSRKRRSVASAASDASMPATSAP